MLTKGLPLAASSITLLLVLWVIGRHRLAAEMKENSKALERVGSFVQDFVLFANSAGRDERSFADVLLKAASVEADLGADNIARGIRIGPLMLNGVRLIPFSIYEIRRLFGSRIFVEDAHQAADTIRAILIRHIGRRTAQQAIMMQKHHQVTSCISEGWLSISSLPIAILSAFGLIGTITVKNIVSSIWFRLWSFLLAVATISGPIIAYLADFKQVNEALARLFS